MTSLKLTRRAALSAGVTTLGLTLLPKMLRAAPSNNQVFILAFMRGGADGLSFVQPTPGSSAARGKYEAWRGAQTRVSGTIPLGAGLSLHRAFEPLRILLDRRELCVVPGVGGAQFNRSHFEQQDLVESGAPETGAPLVDGFLGRALDQLPVKDSPLSGVALSPVAPYSLRHAARAAVAIPDFASFGLMRSKDYVIESERTLRERLQQQYVDGVANCTPISYCGAGARAAQSLDDFRTLRGTGELPASALATVPQLIAADTTGKLKLITFDLGGWDTHFAQGDDQIDAQGAFIGTLAQNMSKLAHALRGLYDAAKTAGVWQRITVAVVTEFGRTIRQNGSAGTDHGFGGTALILGSDLNHRVLPVGYFPASAAAPYYAQAESLNVAPRLIEHRQILGEIVQRRLEVPDLGLVFPGFSLSTTAPRLFA